MGEQFCGSFVTLIISQPDEEDDEEVRGFQEAFKRLGTFVIEGRYF